MYNLMLALAIFFGLLLVFFLSGVAGRRFGEWQIASNPDHKIKIVSIAEGAVFALLGLLIAFTFTGAYERFEARKFRIIDEANAVESAYMNIGLLAPATQSEVLETLKQYVDARLEVYQKMPDYTAAFEEVARSRQLQRKLWAQALAACAKTPSQATTLLLLPALSNMFDIANTRIAITSIHPPLIIFILLIGIAILSVFLAGYSSAKTKNLYSIHLFGYILIIAFLIYVIIDLEMPRLGLIRVNVFDHVLTDVRGEM